MFNHKEDLSLKVQVLVVDFVAWSKSLSSKIKVATEGAERV
jgi:hypothetical protein